MCTTAMVCFLHTGKGGHLDAPHSRTSGSASCLRSPSLSLLAGYPSKRVCVKLCHRAPPCGGVSRRLATPGTAAEVARTAPGAPRPAKRDNELGLTHPRPGL